MDLKLLATFRMVAALKSFSRAASALDYAQSTVTLHVQALEADIGVPLFDRIGKSVALTEAGSRLLTYAERLLTLSDEARVVVSGDGTPGGVLTIGAPETVCTYRLPPVLRRFRQSQPQVRLIFRPLPYEDLFRAAKEGSIDVCFMLESHIDAPALCVERLTDEPLVLVAAPDHPLAEQERVGLTDLADEALLLTETGCGYRTMFEHMLRQAGVMPMVRMEFDSVEAIKQCVMANVGIALLPQIAVTRELSAESMRALVLPLDDYVFHTFMLYHRDRWLSPALNALINMSRTLMNDAVSEETTL
ncbi:MAG: LysR family transcriptional regulator [Chloroflexota bacterium]|nr:LysR family transcriptional regulator [Chloroflexota bacterium]